MKREKKEKKEELEVTYKETPDAHYVDVNGCLNPFTSHLLRNKLKEHNIIGAEPPNPGDGFSYLLKYLYRRWVYAPKTEKPSKKVVLDFKDAVLEGDSAVAISLKVKKSIGSQLEILVNKSAITHFDYRSIGKSDYGAELIDAGKSDYGAVSIEDMNQEDVLKEVKELRKYIKIVE